MIYGMVMVMNKSLGILMTALLLGVAACPAVSAAEQGTASRVRAVSLSPDVDSSRVRSVQASDNTDYSSRVRKAGAAAAQEGSRVRPVQAVAAGSGESSVRKVSVPADSGSAGTVTAEPSRTDVTLLSAPAEQERIKTVRYPGSKLPVSTNMPVGSVYYDYLEKLEGMGYIKSMLYGTRPYSRMDMARWTLEAGEGFKKNPAAADFVGTMIDRLERALAPEIAQIRAYNRGEKPETQFKVQSTKLEMAAADLHGRDGYSYRDLKNAKWQSFSENSRGHRYRDGFNTGASVYMDGSLGRDLAMSVTARAAWDDRDRLTGSLDEAYLTTRMGIWNFDIGRQAISWGQGVNGGYLFTDNARPRTMLKVSNELQPKSKGALAFLGQTKFTAFASRLDGGRTEGGVHDYNHPWLVGFRGDLVWKNFTLGLARASMLGGKGNAFRAGDIGSWLVGKNSHHNDKWNDIAGIDFRWRMPGLQIYGEMYGEDQANYFPSARSYRLGVYIPRLSYDGSWDMRLEAARTGRVLYSHGTYGAGWTYHNDIMGDALTGPHAKRLYGNINYYASASDKIGFHGSYWQADRAEGAPQKVKNAWLTYDKVLGSNDTLNFMLGLSDITRGGKYGIGAKDKIARVIWEHQY